MNRDGTDSRAVTQRKAAGVGEAYSLMKQHNLIWDVLEKAFLENYILNKEE